MGGLRAYLEKIPALGRGVSMVCSTPFHAPRFLAACGAVGAVSVFLGTPRGRRIRETVWRMGFVDRNGEELPKQEKRKPTVFIDLEEVLLQKRFSWTALGYTFTVREHAETFLFHLSNVYEIVCVSSLSPEVGAEVLHKLDPYGCIQYRMFVQDKDALDIKRLGREVATSVWVRGKDSSSRSVLNIGAWSGETEGGLLAALDFLINLNHVELEDYRKVLDTYKEKRFYGAYKEVQDRVYPGKRKWLVLRNEDSVQRRVEEVNELRIKEYLAAKEYIENQLRIAQKLK